MNKISRFSSLILWGILFAFFMCRCGGNASQEAAKQPASDSTAVKKANPKPLDSKPITVVGIVIDQTGKVFKTDSVPVFTTDANKVADTGYVLKANNYGYSVKMLNPALPFSISCNYKNNTFYSYSDTADPSPDTVNVIIDNQSNTPNTLVLQLLNHDGSKIASGLTVNLMNNTNNQKSQANVANGFAILPISAAGDYSFNVSSSTGVVNDANGKPLLRSFTVSDKQNKSTIGYTFFLK